MAAVAAWVTAQAATSGTQATMASALLLLTHPAELPYLIDSHGIEITLLLSKSALLKIGEPYRFYFQKGSRPVVGNDYLDAALSTNSFLGYEAISEPEEHPDPSSES